MVAARRGDKKNRTSVHATAHPVRIRRKKFVATCGARIGSKLSAAAICIERIPETEKGTGGVSAPYRGQNIFEAPETIQLRRSRRNSARAGASNFPRHPPLPPPPTPACALGV